MEEKKKKPDEAAEETKPTEAPEQEKPAEEQKAEPSKEDKPDSKSEEKAEDNPVEEPKEEAPEGKTEEAAPTVPQLSEADKLKAENLTLKTQLEAMKIGFAPDKMEDAVILAEAMVKRDGCDISAALQAVAKKYPDWKSDSKEKGKSGGFKVGADSSGKEKKADGDRLSDAFGIKKRKE